MDVIKMHLSKKDGTLEIVYPGDRIEVYDVPPRTPLLKILTGEVLLTKMDDAVHACPTCLGNLEFGWMCPSCKTLRK
jgi:tRNA(Ile2) C34 agmatinyltransferase TiaS